MAAVCLIRAERLMLWGPEADTGSIHACMRAALDKQYPASISRLGMASHMDV